MIQAPRGTKDVLPQESAAWQRMEAVMRDVCRLAGYREVRTPVIEHTELFQRGVGDTTDVVQKEMYTFEDKGGRSITLKPEGTAGTARLFIEHGLFNEPLPLKAYYLYCPVFRYEAPQSGRLREHHQFGVEVFGAKEPTIDVEVIRLAMDVIERLGGKNLRLFINSIGCPTCRARYTDALRDFLRPKLTKLCPTCQGRFEKNPMRILDCKDPGCKAEIVGAPSILEYLCNDCAAHFARVKELLTVAGVPYEVDPGIVRGLDYYTKTVFEIMYPLENGQLFTACGGGRYDGLVESVGGPSVPGIGFGMGMERLLMALSSSGAAETESSPLRVYVASMGQAALDEAFRLTRLMRLSGIPCDMDHAGRSLKAQFKYAGKLGPEYVVVIGEDELKENKYRLRDMRSREETLLSQEELLCRLSGAEK